jgi:hypothetical protein
VALHRPRGSKRLLALCAFWNAIALIIVTQDRVAVLLSSIGVYLLALFLITPRLVTKSNGQVVLAIGPKPVAILAVLGFGGIAFHDAPLLIDAALVLMAGGCLRWYLASASPRWRTERRRADTER